MNLKKIILVEKVFVNKTENSETIKKNLTELTVFFLKITNKVKREMTDWDKTFKLYITGKGVTIQYSKGAHKLMKNINCSQK